MSNIVFMPTCKKRTNKFKSEVQEAINSLSNQVDKIYLIVSKKDYDNELPNFINCELFIIEENFYVFNRFIPLKTIKLEPDDNIIFADDDWKYNSDYVNFMLNRLNNFDCASIGNGGCISAFTILKRKCINDDFFNYISKDLINTHIDDCYLTNYLLYKNYRLNFYNECIDNIVREHATPLITESVNNPNNEIYSKTFNFAANYKPWKK